MYDSLLDSIDIYGWDKMRENMVLAALIAHLNTLIMGDKGMGKTLVGLRLAEAMDVAAEAKGFGGVEATKVDGHSANEEDLVGYPMPPDDERMAEARKNDERVYMENILSPNTIAHSEFIVLDEATRIPHHMQSRYLSMMEEGIVDGRELELKWLFGAANPISYAATEEMDEALADRWEFTIPAPDYENDMAQESRMEILKTRAEDTHDSKPDEEAAIRIWEFIEEGKEAYESTMKNDMNRVSQYVDNVVCLINRGIKGKTTADDPDMNTNGLGDSYTHTAPIGARRATIILNNIFALQAVSLVRGDGEDISDLGEVALKNSLVHALHGDEPIPDEMLKVAHDAHKGLLQSKEERVVSMIENKDDPVERAALSLRLRARTEDATRYVQEAHDSLRENGEDSKQHAFSYVLFNRLQSGDEELIGHLDHRIFDQLVSDVHDILDAAEDFSIEEESVHPEMGGIKDFEEIVKKIEEKRQTPRGRAAVALAIYDDQGSKSSGRTNPLNTGGAHTDKYKSLLLSINTAEENIEEMIDYFTDLSRHQHALE